MGVMRVFGKIEMDLELFSGEIRPYGSEWELWRCPGARRRAGQGGDGRQGFQTDTEVILGGKAVGVLRGLMGQYLKRESWLSGSLAEIAGLKWPVVQFHCLTYLERILRWVSQSVEERERDEKVLNSLLFLCECVAAGEPSKCPASNISTKLIKLCQNRFIRVFTLSI